MRKLLKLISGLSLFVMMTVTIQAKPIEVNLVFGDELIQLEENNIFTQQGITYIPLREVGELFDATIQWEDSTQTIHIKDKQKYITIDTQQLTYSLRQQFQNQLEEKTGVLTIIKKDGRTYLPLRLFAELFEHPIDYLPEGPIVRIKRQDMVLTDMQVVEKYKLAVEQKQKETIYLTFDDGPNEHTEDILDLLLESDMQATFFVLEGGMKKYPHLVQRMIDEGHTVGLHGVTHRKDLFYKGVYGPYHEIEQSNQTLENLTGTRSQVIRMPYGSVPYLTKQQLEVLLENNYELWDWHVDSRDWANKDGEITYRQIVEQLNRTKAKAPIVLLHDSEYTVETVNYLIDWMHLQHKTSKPLTQEMDGRSFKEANMY